MPKGYPPAAFVSSTCYDLNQVRADLRRFLIDLGLDPILSETPAFPVSPHVGPIDNCLRAVKEKADIFILIIGGRYGFQNESGKSVTNLEYLEAKAKGLPIYIFVQKQILNVFPVWKKNPTGGFKGIVDTPKLFEFVESLRNTKDHWVFEFEEVRHIIDTLRAQLAYLFMDGLVLREKVKDLKVPAALIELSGKSLRLVLERPLAWEYQFFSSVLRDEYERDQELKWDLKYGQKTQSIHKLDSSKELTEWLLKKMRDITALVNSAESLMNCAIQEALGAPGVAGDPEHLVYVAKGLAKIRKSLLQWTIGFNCTEVTPECEKLLSLISNFSKDVVHQLECFPSLLESEIEKALQANSRGEEYVATVMLTLSLPEQPELQAEFEKLTAMIESGYFNDL